MYVNQKELHNALSEYLLSCEAAVAEGKEKPVMSRYIGECIMLICQNLAKRANFSQYTYKEDMIDNGIELCIRYLHNYNFRQYSNPHVFLTRYAWRGFVDVINNEKDESYVKAKMMISPEEMNQILQGVDKDFQPDADDIAIPYFDIASYEAKRFAKKDKDADPDELIGLEMYIEELTNQKEEQ